MPHAVVEPAARASFGFVVRPTILYVTAFVLSTMLHESVHGLTTSALGFDSTLFQLWVTPHASNASAMQRAIIAASGPMVSLLIGGICVAVYRRSSTPRGLFWLMFTNVNLCLGCGNIMGAALGGDGHRTAVLLGLSRATQVVISLIGFVGLSGVLWWTGRELMKWAPAGMTQATALVLSAAAPGVVGPVLVLAAAMPLPSDMVAANLSPIAFWLIAIAGAATANTRSTLTATAVSGRDLLLAGVALLTLRALAMGVRIPAL